MILRMFLLEEDYERLGSMENLVSFPGYQWTWYGILEIEGKRYVRLFTRRLDVE